MLTALVVGEVLMHCRGKHIRISAESFEHLSNLVDRLELAGRLFRLRLFSFRSLCLLHFGLRSGILGRSPCGDLLVERRTRTVRLLHLPRRDGVSVRHTSTERLQD